MIYITNEDLSADSYQRFITESVGDGVNVLDRIELKAIAIVKSFIAGRYDVGGIFGIPIEEEEGEEPVLSEPLRDELLADIITKIVLFKLFGRNAARKVPTDVADDNKWAMEQLEKINSGRVKLNLPVAIEESTGGAVSNSMWGNNTNVDFYI